MYTDYLLTTPTQDTCTGLSIVLHGQISHDRFTRMFASGTIDSKHLWAQSKPLVEEMVDSSDCVVVEIDDTIQKNPHSREKDLICWHYDHTEGETIKGINFLSAVLTTEELAFPIVVEFVRKTLQVPDENGQLHRRSQITRMIYSAECWTSIKTLAGQDQPLKVWLRGMDNPLLLIKQVFKNEDGSEGGQYLVASDLTFSASEIIGIYQKRWKTEEYHKSIKQCSSLGDSPSHTPATQQAHCIAAIISYVKLEKLKLENRMNQFALKSRIWIEATRHAMDSMSKLSKSSDKYAYLTT